MKDKLGFMSTKQQRSNLARSLDRSLIVIFCGGLMIALMSAALLPIDGSPSGYTLVLFPLVFLIYLTAGLRAWHRRPGNRLGALILFGGFAFLMGGLHNTSVPELVAAGTVGSTLVLAVTVHMLHAFPSGRLHGRLSRATVITAYVNSLLLQAPDYLFGGDGAAPLLFITDNEPVVAAAFKVQQIVGAAVMGSTALVLIKRLIHADAARRRVLLPLFAYGAFAVVLVPVGSMVLGPLFGLPPEALAALQLISIGGIPLAFTHGILRGGFAKTGELEELGTWLGDWGGTRPALTTALARALGDPSLTLAFWVPRQGSFVDENGRPVAALQQGQNRGAIDIELQGRTVGSISYDASVIEEPEMVRTAGRVVALAADRERLTAELRESHGELQRSRERLLDAADRERRRIARDLHDGLQMQLVLLALEAQIVANSLGADAGTAARVTQLRRGIDSAAADLRLLVQDVMPAALIERGFVAAAEDLADRMPIPTTLDIDMGELPCPAALESTAYFVLAEALTNTIKHAGASTMSVGIKRATGWLTMEMRDDGVGGASLEGGTGLRGVSDRVDVLGGQFTLDSAPGHGTRITMELPCA